MTKKIHDDELLFDVKDVKSSKKTIILGNDLHIPDIDPNDGSNWCIESLLMAHEIAMDNDVDMYNIPHAIDTWEISYYCRINEQTYRVTESKKGRYGNIDYKIELV